MANTLPKGDLDLKVTERERFLLAQGLACRSSVLRRRINTEENQAIREVLDAEHKQIQALAARL